MTRFTKVLAVASALLVLPSIAMAISLDIVGVSGAGAGGVLLPGETVTFDLRIDWTGLSTDVYGVSADVTGYDLPDTNEARQLNVALAGGTSVGQVLGIDIGSGPQFGILDGQNGPIEVNGGNQLNPQAWSTTLFGGVAASPAAGDGSADVGIGGSLVTSGDVHFQVTFQNVFPAGPGSALTPQNVSFDFDLVLVGAGGALLPTTGDSFSLLVVPEPGTAMLMGLGLAGLATIRRR